MITVAGFNTAIDRRVDLGAPLTPGAVQRASSGRGVPGGKGVHVAQMVAELGEPVRLVGLTDELHGHWVDRYLKGRRVEWHGVVAPFELRQCLAFRDAAGQTTEVLEPSQELNCALQDALLDALQQSLTGANVLVLSGSLPLGFSASACAFIVRSAAKRGVRCLVDTSGEPLCLAVEAKPWLVKPNTDEATALMGKPVRDVPAAAACVRALQWQGVEHPVVTLGADGAVAGDGDTVWHVWSDPVVVRNSVGSGDCFAATLAVGALRDDPFDEVLKRAVACGAASAEGVQSGFVNAQALEGRLQRCHVERVRRVAVRPLKLPTKP